MSALAEPRNTPRNSAFQGDSLKVNHTTGREISSVVILKVSQFNRTPYGDKLVNQTETVEAVFYRSTSDSSVTRTPCRFRLRGKRGRPAPTLEEKTDIYAGDMSPELVVQQAVKSDAKAVILQTKAQAREIGLIAEKVGIHKIYVPPQILKEIRSESKNPELFATLPKNIVQQIADGIKTGIKKAAGLPTAQETAIRQEQGLEGRLPQAPGVLLPPLEVGRSAVLTPDAKAQGPMAVKQTAATLPKVQREAFKEIRHQEELLKKIMKTILQDTNDIKSGKLAPRKELIKLKDQIAPAIENIIHTRKKKVLSGDQEALKTLTKEQVTTGRVLVEAPRMRRANSYATAA